MQETFVSQQITYTNK